MRKGSLEGSPGRRAPLPATRGPGGPPGALSGPSGQPDAPLVTTASTDPWSARDPRHTIRPAKTSRPNTCYAD